MDFKKHKEKLPIGIDDYKKLIDGKCVYIDKTLLVQEFWDDGAEVILVTRPRRFGKSIALSMLRYFFEKTEQSGSYLFEKSNIWKEEKFREIQGTYPVIYISFKDVKAKTWEEAYQEFTDLLATEVRRTLKRLEHVMSEDYREQYLSFISKKASKVEFGKALLFITNVFYECCSHQKTIVLIDEYDTPITNAYLHGYYEEAVAFMRQLLSKALKSNTNLAKCFMTGVVRTARDGILSGLNNPDIYTMLDAPFADKFGFTEPETTYLLDKFHRLDKKEELKSWYNGYVVGSKYPVSEKIYNPWSVLQYVQHSCIPEMYWSNTGSTELLEKLIAEADDTTQKELQTLLEEKYLENKQINQDVILLDLNKKGQDPWSFLLFAGYVTAVSHVFRENKHYYTLAIPNEEIRELYKKLIETVINKSLSSKKLTGLLDALIEGNTATVSSLLEQLITNLCSSHDLAQNDFERSIHLFVLGLLAALSDRYVIKSNLESGNGRYDIAMHPKNASDPAVIIEFKRGTDYSDLEPLAEEALRQIEDKNYVSLIREFGYKGKTLCYGIAAFKKQLRVKLKEILQL